MARWNSSSKALKLEVEISILHMIQQIRESILFERGMGMDIVVLLKQTFDTEEKITIEHDKVSEEGVKFVMNPYDEYAVEEAIRLRDQHGGRVTILSLGPQRCAEAMRAALAMGADDAILIHDERIGTDEYSVSKTIAAAISRRLFDIVLGGNFSVDHGAGQIAIRVAQLLGISHVGSVTRLEIQGEQATAYRDAEGDTEIVETVLPALFTAQQGLNEPRYPSLPGIMKAKKKPFQQLTLEDLNLIPSDIPAKTERIALTLPPKRKEGQILQGEIPAQAARLVQLLRYEAKVI